MTCSFVRNLFITKNLIEFFVLLITSKQELETSFRFYQKLATRRGRKRE